MMIAINKKESYMSRFTLMVFESTGWYKESVVEYFEPMVWGKGQGCSFLDIDDCSFDKEFCPVMYTTTSDTFVDFQKTAFGFCRYDLLANTCPMVNYYTNTICTDPETYLVSGPTTTF